MFPFSCSSPPPPPSPTTSSAPSESRASATVVHNDDDDDDDDDDDPEDTSASEPGESEDVTYLCLYMKNEELGAALYNVDSASLAVLRGISDLGPDFKVTRALLNQTNPRHVVVDARLPEIFLNVVRRVCVCVCVCGAKEEEEEDATALADDGEELEHRDEEMDTTNAATDYATETTEIEGDEDTSFVTHTAVRSTTEIGEMTSDFALRNTDLHMINFASCRRRILNLELPQEECEDIAAAGRPLYTEEDHHLFINSLFDLNCESGVRAAGSMLQFADSNSVGGVNLESRSYRRAKSGNSGGSCLVLQVKTLAVDEVVSIDETTFTALQIFSSKMQPTSGSRFGSWNKNRDGLSLFGIVNTCKSVLGAKYLRYMFRCPPRNISTILQRQDVVAFFANPAQNDLAKLLQSCLKNVKNIPRLLRKLAATQASVSDWKCLRKSIHNLIRIGEIASCERDGVSILDKLSDSVSTDLHAMAEYIERVMDIDKSKTRGRFSVNAGIDDELDQMRRVHNGLPDLLFKVAQEEIHDLPEYMTECTMSYVPQIGYMLIVQPWRREEPLSEEELDNQPDLQFIFVVDGIPHFKTKRCRELDEVLGDTATSISEHETAIMVRLTNHILAKSEMLLMPTRYAALLDCLLSLAGAAVRYNWRRPYVAEQIQQMQITNGRHPLQELCSDIFVANHTLLGQNARMAVLTGPNACGKSVYLKQVGLIAYLAHLGSWVPAEVAVVPIIDQISTRIQTIESVSLGLSAFMVDVNQMSLALRSATSRSLLLVDEFGKGTSEIDGQALLAACLKNLLDRGHSCPLTLVSTHFYNIRALLGPREDVAYNTFDHMEQDENIVYLYKLKSGLCTSSQAHVVARRAGVEAAIIERSNEVLGCLRQGKPIKSSPGARFTKNN